MTPERAKELAEAAGCSFVQAASGSSFVIMREPDNWAYVPADELDNVTEAKFNYFYIPEER